MFHWICPECGREIPPAVRECPGCDPQIKQNDAAPAPVAAAAAPAAVSSAPAVLNTLPVAIAEPEPAALPQEAPIDPRTDPLLALAEQIRAAQVGPLEPAPVTNGLAGLVAAVGLSDELSDAPTLDLIPIPVEAAPPKTEPRIEAQPEPIASTLVAVQDAVPHIVPHVVQQPQPVALLASPAEEPALAEPIPDVLPSAVPHLPSAAPSSSSAAAPLIRETPPPVPETPADKPPSGSWLRLAPLQDYTAAASRAMHPVPPMPRILTPDSGPRITLPGPQLPPELTVRKDLHVVTVLGQRNKRRGIPGWLISAAVMLLLLGAGVGVVLYLLPASRTTADAKAPAPQTETPVAAEPSHPLSEYIEVTGFRFIMDLNKKSEIHYLVVNHSPADLGDVTVFVTVRTANARAGQPPLCRFSFRAPGLGPFESKEMISSIEKLSRPVTVPDWHELHAEVQISQ